MRECRIMLNSSSLTVETESSLIAERLDVWHINLLVFRIGEELVVIKPLLGSLLVVVS